MTAFAPSLYLAVPGFAFLGGCLCAWTCVSAFLEGGFKSSQGDFQRRGGECILWADVRRRKHDGANYSGAASIVNGNITMKTWEDFRMLFIYAVIGLVLAVFLASKCDILGLEDQTIRSLLAISQCGASYSVCSCSLALISTAVVGSISFLYF